MADTTGIEWTDATWNPVRGCSRVSEGCRNCYAETFSARFSGPGQPYEGLAERTSKGARWTGEMMFVEKALDQPIRWRRPRMVFVNSMSDLFHEKIPDEWIDKVFAVMALAPQHTFQILTKRPERMRKYLAPFDGRRASALGELVVEMGYAGPLECLPWPLPNVWLGVSVEDQAAADERIPHLLATPAAVRFISAEPLLGPVDLTRWLWGRDEACPDCPHDADCDCGLLPRHMLEGETDIAWVICGGESGPGARPMHPDWARGLRDQCAAAGVPFFFKQWGEWGPEPVASDNPHCVLMHGGEILTGTRVLDRPDENAEIMFRIGKKRAGAMLDGREHREWPETAR